MKSPAATLFTLLAAAAMMFAVPTHGAPSPPDSKTQHLFHQLKIHPEGATPFRTVDKLVLALVKRDPIRSVKYYKVALMKLDDSTFGKAYLNTLKLAKQIARIVKRSALSDSQIDKIMAQIGYILVPGYPGAPSPTPTPEPTP